MKRRIIGGETQAGSGEAVEVSPEPPKSEPIPACLARWTGNLLYWVSSLGAQYYAQAVAPLGLLPSHVAVLQILAAEGSMRQARLTDRTRIDKATMVGLLNELERQSLTKRRPSPNDKRAFDVYLTDKGNERVQQIESVSEAAEAQFFAALSKEEQATFRGLLERLAKEAPQPPA